MAYDANGKSNENYDMDLKITFEYYHRDFSIWAYKWLFINKDVILRIRLFAIRSA